MLQDLDKEKKLENTRKEFIAGVSHELKTPLRMILLIIFVCFWEIVLVDSSITLILS